MKLKKLSWMPAAILMLVIYQFSSKTADLSGESSLAISKAVLHFYETISKIQWQQGYREEILGVLDHVVRKTAHFTEYAILAATFSFHFTVWRKKAWQRIALPVLLAGLYAAGDEYHQTFVAGRSGQVSDVLLDTTGAFVGALIFFLLVYLLQKRRQKALSVSTTQR